MRAAIIENNTIANIVEAASLADVEAIFPSAEVVDAATLPDGVGIGHTRNGEEWEATTPEAVYRSIDKVEAMSLLLSVTGMDMTEELAFRKDPNLELFWIKWREDVQNILYRDHPLTQQILDVLIATGYLSVEQKQEILDLWPTA